MKQSPCAHDGSIERNCLGCDSSTTPEQPKGSSVIYLGELRNKNKNKKSHEV
jgi:hypothetical protein